MARRRSHAERRAMWASIHDRAGNVMRTVRGRVSKAEASELRRAAALTALGVGAVGAGAYFASRGYLRPGGALAWGGGTAAIGGGSTVFERFRKAWEDTERRGGTTGRAARGARTTAGAAAENVKTAAAGAELGARRYYEQGKSSLKTLTFPKFSPELAAAAAIDYAGKSAEDWIERRTQYHADRLRRNAAGLLGHAQELATRETVGALGRGREKYVKAAGFGELTPRERELIGVMREKALEKSKGLTVERALRRKTDKTIGQAAGSIINEMMSQGRATDLMRGNVDPDALKRVKERFKLSERDVLEALSLAEHHARFGYILRRDMPTL